MAGMGYAAGSRKQEAKPKTEAVVDWKTLVRRKFQNRTNVRKAGPAGWMKDDFLVVPKGARGDFMNDIRRTSK